MEKSIVINREYGSGGRTIGKMVAEQLHMPFYDSNILKEVIEKKGFRADVLTDFDEKIIGSLLYNLSILAMGDTEKANMPYKMYGAISEVIRTEAMSKGCVFIGRCADKILLENKIPFVSVFVYSDDMEAKVRRAVETDAVDASKAENFIYKKDKARREYQHFFTHSEFGNYREYDLCLNSAKLGYDVCAEMIKTAHGVAVNRK